MAIRRFIVIILLLIMLCSSVQGANEINAFAPGVTTAYAVIREVDGDVWNPTTQVFETWGASGHMAADYDLSLSNKEGGMFVGIFDSNVTAGIYNVVVHYQVGATPGNSDPAVWQEHGYWTGQVWGSDVVAALPTKEQIRAEVDSNSIGLDILVDYANEWDPNFSVVTSQVNEVLVDTGTTLPAAIDAVTVDVNVAAIADAVHDEPIEGTITLRQAVRLFLSVLTGKSSGGGTTSIKYMDMAGTKNRVVGTVDSKGNRTAVTRDPD